MSSVRAACPFSHLSNTDTCIYTQTQTSAQTAAETGTQTYLDEIVQVAQLPHVADTSLLGHILQDFAEVVRGIWGPMGKR